MTVPPGATSLVVGLFTAVATEIAKKAPGDLPNPKNAAAVRLFAAVLATGGVVAFSVATGQTADTSSVAPMLAEALTAYFVAAGVYGHTK
jgi:hypothetical protein